MLSRLCFGRFRCLGAMRAPGSRVRLTARGAGMRIGSVIIAENRSGLLQGGETARMRRRWPWSVGLLGVLTCACLAAWVAMRRHGVAALDQGELAYQNKDWSRASLVARAALKERPSDLSALRLLARASARLGKDETAEAIYRRLGTKAMEAEDLFLLGQGLIKRDQKGPGLTALRAARDLDPDHAEALDALINARGRRPGADPGLARCRAVGTAEWLGSSRHADPGQEFATICSIPPVRWSCFLEALRRDPLLAQSSADRREVKRLLARCLLETNRPGRSSSSARERAC